MPFRKLIFSQASGLIDLGAKRIVDVKDKLELPELLSAYNPEIDKADIDWTSNKTLYKSLFRANKSILINSVCFQIIASLFSFATPILIHNFISGLQQNDWSQNHVLVLMAYAIGFGLCGAGNGIAIQHYFFHTLNFFQVTTNIVNKKIFTHALKLSSRAKQKYQVGDIVNFMSSDTDALGDGAIVTIDLSNAVLLLTGCSALLFYYIGWSAIGAVAVMAILIPLTQRLAKKFVHMEEEMMAQRDNRMTLMTQILNSIRVVKYFSWEKSVQDEVTAVRNKEIGARFKLAKSEILWGLLYSSISTVVLFVALTIHYYRGQTIDLALVLTCISIFSLMEDHFGGLSRFISRLMNVFVSGRRITDFVKSETVDSFAPTAEPAELAGEHVVVKDLHFGYDIKTTLFNNLSFSLKQGESLAIIGAVGSGKSTILQLFLKEIAPTSGIVHLSNKHRKAYIPQEAYIVNSTLKENLFFGEDQDQAVLDRAINLSCLRADINLLPKGTETEIGEKGVNLSGGQKQRVSLARAVIANPDVILLDDPLSAVDPHTEKLLCDQLIFGEWKNKTRIMATHRISHLERFDKILFLIDGHYQMGTYQELLAKSTEFKKYLEIEKQNQKHEIEIQKSSQVSEVSTPQADGDGRMTVDEDREVGSVKADIYWDYIKALGGDSPRRNLFIALLFLGAVVHVSAPMMQRAWLTQMSGKVDALQLVLGYGAFGLFTMLLTFMNNYQWTYRGVSAGRLMHDKMLKSVLKSQIRFFDSTPIGRILQRFSRDIESVDIHLQWTFDNAIHSLFNVLSAFILIVVALPVSLVVLTPVFFVYYSIQNRYRRVAREVKRLDSTARSPRYAHFKETLQGLTVIRSFNSQEWFTKEFLQKLNFSTEMFYTHYMVNRWFSSRLPLIGATISMTTAMAVILASSKGWLTAGLAGLVTLYALEFWRHLNWGVRIFSDLESRMTSVERLGFYTNLPAEKDDVKVEDFKKSHPAWPNSGSLEFKNVFVKYADHLPNVLKGVSFVINSGARAGVVGRTGSGKSTLFQTVYRFVDYFKGEILIDGLAVNQVPLEILRQNLAVIPQDPSLFMGSLRSNIDRYSQKSDADVWAVLEKVGLKNFVQGLPGQLANHVTENGSNLSQGQRQLICLARALLMKVKIIFLDEATASVDLETDALIQNVIRTSLDGITLVTIAHRLSTLKDYDQIIELQNGQVVRSGAIRAVDLKD
ncbi:multidrug ABC transporter ATP-binding protein [Bdellovibrio sp. qaytius]|nr:multidrug ABC transporter ATP-binding protein [Bdellovibrio sp. qaytius]